METKRKDQDAVRLGRKGGLKGGPARAANMTPEERSASARNAVLARWAKEKRGIRVRPEIRGQFSELTEAWRAERRATSSTVAIAMHPAYQRIIGLGWEAVPLILGELKKKPDHWFWALKAITGEDPVSPETRGRMQAMADAWLTWGHTRGYVE